jgi:argininosuccinate synthase
MPLLDLIASLTTIAGAHGVGRVDVVERAPGGEVRVVCEAPAAVVLHTAHQQLQQLVAAPELERFARIVSLQYADIVQAGRWFTPMREALDAFVERAQARVAGTVRLRLFKGGCRVVGRMSPFANGGRPAATPDAAPEADRGAASAAADPDGPPPEPPAGPSSSPKERLAASRSHRSA